MQDFAFGDEDLERLIRETREKLSSSDETVEQAERRTSTENLARMGRDRSWISIAIISTYALAIIGALVYLLFTAPDCGAAAIETCSGHMARWEAQVGRLQDLIVTAVLPIVTLMLGFYFGTETSRGSGAPQSPA